jgi:membrane dipeptidase
MAHMSDESTFEITRASTKPIIDGHTCSRDSVPGSRGHSDAALRAIADTGGAVGIHFADHMFTQEIYARKYPGLSYVNNFGTYAYHRSVLREAHDHANIKRLRDNAERRNAFFREHGYPIPPPVDESQRATLAQMADQVEYLVNVCGIEHVGLGGDINGITGHSWPLGMDHLGELPHLTAELMRRGWKDESLRKFLSENWYRIFSECLPQA